METNDNDKTIKEVREKCHIITCCGTKIIITNFSSETLKNKTMK